MIIIIYIAEVAMALSPAAAGLKWAGSVQYSQAVSRHEYGRYCRRERQKKRDL